MREIGGYFELELNKGKEYHDGAIRLNLGRTAFEYILRAYKVHKIFLPYFTCDVILEPVVKTGTQYEFYHIDKNLEPVFDFTRLKESDFFLYTNYFGIKDIIVQRLAKEIGNLIIDNSQAFFSKPLENIPTFYSPRKFFGLPDGGYLYSSKILECEFAIDRSVDRFDHLIGRIEDGAEMHYPVFRRVDNECSGRPIKKMSKITQRLLKNIDYENVTRVRRENFHFLHEHLAGRNLFDFNLTSDFVPMVYPFLSDNSNLRLKLISKSIFVATYWPNVLDWVSKNSIEYSLTLNLLPIPVDQRYNQIDMATIIENI